VAQQVGHTLAERPGEHLLDGLRQLRDVEVDAGVDAGRSEQGRRPLGFGPQQ
jgi:hypothetical protein